eukprot:TRINITY_DN5720_c0_g1_i1.p5 TRINITY_DN5720_c0_g1~~TRINITY_DN5720_c0_g1_i1.p5  ORF type:complete len:122 (-),score=4.51 TRINITY_DN5720_c0_g1_i1:1310-1675(-)
MKIEVRYYVTIQMLRNCRIFNIVHDLGIGVYIKIQNVQRNNINKSLIDILPEIMEEAKGKKIHVMICAAGRSDMELDSAFSIEAIRLANRIDTTKVTLQLFYHCTTKHHMGRLSCIAQYCA